ncbi:MAG TPA: VIT and VWA domain-containing protein [Bryobacteraceae bacterium]|nr:VIT and VWA domain-containing protein [Bryobacteraceae bacterium]
MRALVLFAMARCLWADAGVLIPSTLKQPDARVLSLDEMAIDVVIDNGHAKVNIRQIFGSHNSGPLEGNYVFTLPGRALISDFAVWDDVTRIPGVILERKRAEEIYNDIRMQALDPGLLQMGERDADEARRTSIFSARVVPIPAWGTKRVEIEYQERLPVEQAEAYFAIPLRPDVYRAQTAGRLTINLQVNSAHAMRDFQVVSKAFPMQIAERSAKSVKASFDARNVALTEDFAMKYTPDASKNTLEVLTYRDGNDPGFFEASALMALPSTNAPASPRTVVALFDASLSMQWEKLERSFRAFEALLRSLKPADQLNLLVYNEKIAPFAPSPVEATPENVEKALAFLRGQQLRGGTNVQAALDAGLAQTFATDPYLVVLGDLGSTRGILQNGKLAEWYASKWKQVPARPRTYVFAVGDDANLPLGQMLARNNGVFEAVRSTEPVEFKLNAFLSKIGRKPVDNLTLGITPAPNFDLVYPLEESVFPGSVQTWAGQYKKPGGQATFTVQQTRATVPLPAQNVDHPHLPRQWAKARVDALLEKIERDGEDQATIDEIIRLSRKYKFVTPYTSFLAAPRALLRPRLIRPGDPVLRVKTDESITSVVAMFPFGLVKKLRYLDDEDTWQTRFLAPKDLTDGTYHIRLMLRDRQGHTFRESKTFVIASQPPLVRVKLDRKQFHRGEVMKVHVSASDTTRTIVARMYGAAPAYLRWNAEMGSNIGEVLVPASLAAGKYKLTVTAEDFAHNIGTGEVEVEILP